MWSVLVAACLSVSPLPVTGCGERERADPNPASRRIISFVPAATRTVVDLGLGDQLVGVAEHDAAAPSPDESAGGEPLPIVGNFMDIDYERLLTLEPTHVIYPQTARDVPQGLRDLASDAGFVLIVEPYPTSVEEAWGAVSELGDALGLGARRGDDRPDVRLMLDMAQTMNEVAEEAEQRARTTSGPDEPAVLLAFSVTPVVASGPGSVNDDLLKLIGARNAVGDAAVSAVTLDREGLVALAPDVIVLLLPGASEPEARRKQSWFDGLPIPAVRRGRVVALTDPQVLLPATNLPAVMQDISDAVWGSAAGDE